MSRAPAMKCPHCRANAWARTSRELSPLLREIYYQCSDVECGHTWVATLEASRTLSPSAKANPAISKTLPSSQWIPTLSTAPKPVLKGGTDDQPSLFDESASR
ncbi:ogr/Delta-like zinc finger family protein [Alloalcanivorax xenomutans]|uniref:ogr/Delta-like zinc finger family protein n=1 Tax=Alloalcanivorax xenomutans TaxID=1094342 RepID=UPI003BA8DD5E